MRQASQDNPMGVPWWCDATDDVCILEFGVRPHVIEVATTFEGIERDPDGRAILRFRYYPDALLPRLSTDTVRLTVISADGATTYHLRVVLLDETIVHLASEPLAVQTRRLRRFPRTPFYLGPCAAVVHGANGQWRGVIELWVWNVSEQGIGFKAEMGRAFLLSVGDTIRAPITLPGGQRSWLEGNVAWLSREGRGGLLVRRAPHWLLRGSHST